MVVGHLTTFRGDRTFNLIYLKPGLHSPDCGAQWSPMAKWAGFVSTSANSEVTSVNNVTLPGTSSDIGNEGPMFGQHRQTGRKERTCLLIFSMSGVNRFTGVYRVISGRERKRTQVLRDFSRGTSAIFVNVPWFIVFYRLFYQQPHTHTKDPRQTHDASGVGRVYSVGLSGVFLHASALFRYVRVYIGSNSAGNRGWVSIPPMVYHLLAHNRAWIETTSGLITNTW